MCVVEKRERVRRNVCCYAYAYKAAGEYATRLGPMMPTPSGKNRGTEKIGGKEAVSVLKEMRKRKSQTTTTATTLEKRETVSFLNLFEIVICLPCDG